MTTFTIQHNNIMRKELDFMIGQAVATIVDNNTSVNNIHTIIEELAKTARTAALKVYLGLPEASRFNAQRPTAEVVASIKSLYPNKEDRVNAYKYMNMTRRVVALNSILNSTKKLRSVATQTIKGLITSELQAKRGKAVTISQLINKCPLKVANVTLKNGQTKEVSIFTGEELKLQLISELAELDLIDVKISQHTHMVSLPASLAKLVPQADWDDMYKISQMVAKKTISLLPIPLDTTDLITKSSWYYNTPTLSFDQMEFVNTMHCIKYQFVDNALDLIEDAYISHLKDEEGNMPEGWESWVPTRIKFLKEQIAASLANGGHYVPGKFDSALRWYMQSEIGHMQTSPELRALVKVADIETKIKYDFKNNVVQMYSLLMKVKGPAKYVGMVSEEERLGDLRLLIASTLNTNLETDVFNKGNIKPLFMVWAYNAGKDRILDGVTVVEEGLFGQSSTNVKVEGLMALTGAKNDAKNRDIIWSAFETTVTELVPEIVILKALFKKLIKVNPLDETSWTLPDGSIAQYASPSTLSKTLFFTAASGKQHQHLHHKKVIVTNEKSAGLLPRVIHSFDAYVARQLVIRANRLKVTLVPNHDSFTFDVKHEATFFRLIEALFIELLESEAFGNVIAELNTSKKSLAIKQQDGSFITDETIWAMSGKLTVNDLRQSAPVDLED